MSARSSRGGEGGKKNQNTTIIIAALGVLGVVAVGAIIYMATRPTDEVAVQSGTLPAAPTAVDPEGEVAMELDPGSGETDPAAEPTTVADPDEPVGGAEDPGNGADGYTDASAGSHRVGDYEVKVLSAETGIPQFVNRPKDLKDEYFVVTIKVYNRHEGKRMPYKSWTGTTAKSTPKLVDNYDNVMKFQKGSPVEGRRVASVIDPDDSVKEVLVFSKVTGKQKFLLLNLPGSAVQAAEDVCFKIPTAMIGEAPVPEESSEPLDTRPKRRATKGAGDLVDEAAAAKDDPLRAAVAERLDDDGNPIEEEVQVKPDPGPKTGDTLLDQLSEQHGF